MKGTVWKSFKFADLFVLDGSYNTKTSNKNLNIRYTKDAEHNLLLINKGGTNNAEEGYIKKEPFYKTCSNGITMDDQFGNCFYHDSEFIMTGGGHINVVLFKSDKFKKIADSNIVIYHFIATMLRKIFQKTGIYGYMYKITDERPLREMILLPVMEVKFNENYIWEENGKYWTLDVDYIKTLMLEAKKRKEEKTIRLYEAERAKYEAERAKYEKGYLEEREVLVWKSFKLDELFETSTEHYLEKSKKNYDISEFRTDTHPIAVCAASKNNNGIVGYIGEVDDVPIKKRRGYLTKGGFGHCFYQEDWFIKPGGSWGMLDIIKIKNNSFKTILDENTNGYYFLAKILTKIFTNMASWGYAVPFNREIILLPVIEVTSHENHIWEENGKFWTLANNTASYLYLQGQINIQQRKIDSYSHPY